MMAELVLKPVLLELNNHAVSTRAIFTPTRLPGTVKCHRRSVTPSCRSSGVAAVGFVCFPHACTCMWYVRVWLYVRVCCVRVCVRACVLSWVCVNV